MAFAKPSEYKGGSYFKPADYANSVALLLEPQSIQKNVPNTYGGQTRMRDEVTTTITVFATSEALAKGAPSEILKDCRVTHAMLASTLERLLGNGGGAMGAVLRKVPTKNGSGWAFQDLAPEVEAQVVAYYEGREAALKAAMAAAPDFD